MVRLMTSASERPSVDVVDVEAVDEDGS